MINLVVTIAGVDRTQNIAWQSFQKQDILNYQVDTCSFDTKKYGDKTWRPNVGEEITIVDGTTKVFGGVIVQVEETIEGLVLNHNVQCKDWTHYLDRNLIVERYENMTVNQIIADINTNYITGFTVANVNCTIPVKSITFDRLSASKCLQLLAEKTNYSWYVDYNKDIHFFSKNSEPAPFALSDTADNYVFRSLRIKEDLTQLRNSIYIRGGEVEGTARTENYTGDGTKKTFALSYKFSKLPTVTVAGVSKTVGVDYIDKDTDFDCLWSYNEKYVRFVNAPANASAIIVTGTPLIPLIMQTRDEVSVKKYGVYEFSITDKTITTIEEARQYAQAQLEAYANKISEGGFDTYNSGLRSGQVIRIQSDIRGLNDDYVIQRVSLSMRTPTEGLWSVELATLRTLTIIDFLQRLLLANNTVIEESDSKILEKSYVVAETAEVTEEITRISPYSDYQTAGVTEDIAKDPMGANVSPEWVLAPYVPTGHSDPKREGLLDVSLILY